MTLYNLRFKGLLSRDLVKATRQGLETPELRGRVIADKGDIFMLVLWQSLLLPFSGELYSGSRKACRFLEHGSFQTRLQPPPSRLETENGKPK